MAKPPDAQLVSSVIFVDGVPFLITSRERGGFVARRLKGLRSATSRSGSCPTRTTRPSRRAWPGPAPTTSRATTRRSQRRARTHCSVVSSARSVRPPGSSSSPGCIAERRGLQQPPRCRSSHPCLIAALPAYRPGGKRCRVRVNREGDRSWSFHGFDLRTATCFDQLQRAELATLGECAQPGCGGCCSRFVAPAGPAEIDDGSLAFPCGQSYLTSVDSISTAEDGRTATIRYTTDTRFNEDLLGTLSSCQIDRGSSLGGVGSKTRTAHRDDSGDWSLNGT
jgi:hypothetical protein